MGRFRFRRFRRLRPGRRSRERGHKNAKKKAIHGLILPYQERKSTKMPLSGCNTFPVMRVYLVPAVSGKR